ncbi:3-hydroxyacyl-CoA dehydrogenase [Burkholderiaceae bacterium FT117]|uniref:3-hydroxyacyl-CoA dehydrogenase n=1 Tax=Zeimonas sediminis TaxID=2944268 RepID=UPI002342C7F4|nr:3-hydroxyacyl-CoA dehydrogenase [Zeimonas sediminis]MCM5570209.1 3-hydroxyacyl-CoA dehydrogenase [Zeimonas sediminis]
MSKETVAIVGAGLIGRAWAIVFARSGFQVRLHDQVPAALDNCLGIIGERLQDLAEFGLISDTPDTILARIRPSASLAEAVDGVVLVQENVAEKLEVKREVFAELDRLAPPDAVLASSTSWLPASSFSEHVPGRARCLVGHPVNPPYLVPLVEIAPAPWTSPQTVARARDIYARAGQTPVTLKKEITGFLLNRVQSAVLSEVFALYRDGYADAEDLDRVLKDGLALRWSFMGPFETIDLNAPGGLVDYAARFGPTYRDVAANAVAFDWDEATVAAADAERRSQLPLEDIEKRSAWRDRRLMALLAHKRGQPES